jgi:two-component system sensor histidine kinase CpxA
MIEQGRTGNRGKMFMKIFLWFMAALAIILVVGITSAYFAHQGMTRIELTSELGQALDDSGPNAVDIYEKEGIAGLEDFLRIANRGIRGKMLLFSPEGKPLLRMPRRERQERIPREIEQRLENYIRDVAKTEKARFVYLRPLGIIAKHFISEKGNSYVFAAYRFIPPPIPSRENAGSILLRLLLILVAGAGACYWLANNMAVPIRKLHRATGEIARGNLAVRVEKKLTRRNDEIGDLGRGFNIMAEHLEDLIGAQKRLISDISHELRTPLARLNIALGLARQHSGPDAEKALNRIELETERLNEMIGQLLSLSRLEADMGKIQKVRINLTELIKNIVSDAMFEAKGKNCSVKFTQEKDIYIFGDSTLIARAIENAVRNALKHTPEESDVDISLVETISETEQSMVRIRIRDNGEGVNENELSNIFKPFYRLDSARDRKTGGTGLGLSIAERAVRLHGGSIRAFNADEGGLVVEIELPKE